MGLDGQGVGGVHDGGVEEALLRSRRGSGLVLGTDATDGSFLVEARADLVCGFGPLLLLLEVELLDGVVDPAVELGEHLGLDFSVLGVHDLVHHVDHLLVED